MTAAYPEPTYRQSRRKRKSLAEKKRAELTPEKVCEVIMAERGILVEIAASLCVSRKRIREYISEIPLCAQTLKEAREAMGDVAEKKLYELIEAGDVRCITYYLSTAHRNRGYGIHKDEAAPDPTERHTHVHTINIVSVPPGVYLTDNNNNEPPVIEHVPTPEPVTVESEPEDDLFT